MSSIHWVWSVPQRSMWYPSERWRLARALRPWRCALRGECVIPDISSFPFKTSRGVVLLHWTSPLGWAALLQVKGHQDQLIMNWALRSGIEGDLCSFRHCDGAFVMAAFGKTPAPALLPRSQLHGLALPASSKCRSCLFLAVFSPYSQVLLFHRLSVWWGLTHQFYLIRGWG